MNKKTGIIGTGRLGKNLLYYLIEKKVEISGIFNSDQKTSEKTREITGAKFFSNLDELVKASDIIFLTTPDDIIEKTADKISKSEIEIKDKFFFHCSGSLPSTILSSLKSKGAFTASLHPLQSFAGLSASKNPFRGIIMGIEGDSEAVDTGKNLAIVLGSLPYTLKTEGKSLYHAAAVIASNYLVTLTDISLTFLEAAGIEKEKGLHIITPLIKGTLENIISKGTKKALTGPVARGDSQTIASHRKAILESIPDMDNFYKTMCIHTVKIAEDSGYIGKNESQDIYKALE
ncbi:MAG: DUF2520 domain-containing protein [Desulfobacteraceae bacterium]|nr:DUF2520 domain-containing protein [Desulfobacteraceae bacterium]